MNERDKCNIEDRGLSRTHKLRVFLYYIAATLTPSIFLFFLYNQNHRENHIVFGHVLILAIVFAMVGLVIFIVFKFAVAGEEGALGLSLMFWLAFWLFEVLLNLTRIFTILTEPRRLMVLLLVFFLISPVLFRRLGASFEMMRPVFNILAVCLIGIFLFNFIPGINHEISVARAREQIAEAKEREEMPFYIKKDFIIDSNLPTPDIYWIHIDGMMNIETVESFWGLCYEHFREEIEERGFLIYREAMLNAGSTYPALTALLSPAFYDSFFGELLARKETLLQVEQRGALWEELAQVGLTYAEDIMPYLELFHGLALRGYAISTPEWGEMPTSFEHLIVASNSGIRDWWENLQTGYLPELLSMTTPLNIHTNIENVPNGSILDEGVLNGNVPDESVPNEIAHLEHGVEPVASFVWWIIHDAHMYSIGTIAMEQDPTLNERDYTRYDLYPVGFERAVERTLGLIDEILDRNPNAVIVLQSDHGFHYGETQQYLLEKGYSLEQVLELNNSVFSAVRIPPEYGGLESPIAPLNISRELMNRFVGGNYELLPSR